MHVASKRKESNVRTSHFGIIGLLLENPTNQERAGPPLHQSKRRKKHTHKAREERLGIQVGNLVSVEKTFLTESSVNLRILFTDFCKKLTFSCWGMEGKPKN